MRMDEIARSIRSKYVGTAEEHEFLADVVSEYAKSYRGVQEWIEELKTEAERNLEEIRRETSHLSTLADLVPVDLAMRRYVRYAFSIDDQWELKNLAMAIKETGLSEDVLAKVAGLMADMRSAESSQDA